MGYLNCDATGLDMSCNDDYARARIGNSAESFAVLRRIALNFQKRSLQKS